MPKRPAARQSAGRGEAGLARHVERLRREREWSYETLAKKMTEAGCAVSKAALYSIEQGDPPRRITVDELLGFSRVFGVSPTRLLLPPDLAAKKEAEALWDQYETARRRMVELQRQMDQLEDRILDLVDTDQRAAVLEALRQEAGEELALGEMVSHMRLTRGYRSSGEDS